MNLITQNLDCTLKGSNILNYKIKDCCNTIFTNIIILIDRVVINYMKQKIS